VRECLRRAGEPLGGLDANNGGDGRGLETTPSLAQKRFHGGDVEPAAELI